MTFVRLLAAVAMVAALAVVTACVAPGPPPVAAVRHHHRDGHGQGAGDRGVPAGEGRSREQRVEGGHVDDVDAEYGRLGRQLDEIVTEPTTMPWGNRALLFRDPDGNLIEIASYMNR